MSSAHLEDLSGGSTPPHGSAADLVASISVKPGSTAIDSAFGVVPEIAEAMPGVLRTGELRGVRGYEAASSVLRSSLELLREAGCREGCF